MEEALSPQAGANTDLYIHTENNFDELLICIYLSLKSTYLECTGCIISYAAFISIVGTVSPPSG